MMSRISRGALLGVAVGIAGIVASNTPLGLNLEENQGLEVLFLLRGHRTPPRTSSSSASTRSPRTSSRRTTT